MPRPPHWLRTWNSGWPRSRSWHSAAVADYEALVQEHPKVQRYRGGLGRSRTDLGNILHVLGRNEEAEVIYRRRSPITRPC